MTIINATQLRSECGSPPRDPADPAYTTDAELQAIIDRFTDNYQDLVNAEISKYTLTGEGLPWDRAEKVTIDLATVGSLAIGDIPPTHISRTRKPVRVGDKVLSPDSDIERTAALSLFETWRYEFRGSELLVTPNDTDSVELWLVPVSEIKNVVESAISTKLNADIIKAAREMVVLKISEGQRQENEPER